MLKFRSMCLDAETHLTALLDSNEGAGPLFTMTDDPRITRTGAVLRHGRPPPRCAPVMEHREQPILHNQTFAGQRDTVIAQPDEDAG